MNDLPALITAVTALVTAVGGVIALFRHVAQPAGAAHPAPEHIPLPPLGPVASGNPTTAIQQAPSTPPAS